MNEGAFRFETPAQLAEVEAERIRLEKERRVSPTRDPRPSNMKTRLEPLSFLAFPFNEGRVVTSSRAGHGPTDRVFR